MANRLLCPQGGPRQQLQASAPPDSVPSLQNMALLLDKLAKENQDIRLLQAQLQVGTVGTSHMKCPLLTLTPGPAPFPRQQAICLVL